MNNQKFAKYTVGKIPEKQVLSLYYCMKEIAVFASIGELNKEASTPLTQYKSNVKALLSHQKKAFLFAT